jgi:hypothetical protein
MFSDIRTRQRPTRQTHRTILLLGKRTLVRRCDLREIERTNRYRRNVVRDLSHGWRDRNEPDEIANTEAYIAELK